MEHFKSAKYTSFSSERRHSKKNWSMGFYRKGDMLSTSFIPPVLDACSGKEDLEGERKEGEGENSYMPQ